MPETPDFSLVDVYRDSPKYATNDIGEKCRIDNPGAGWCLRCGVPEFFSFTKYRVHYSKNSGMIPICQSCWDISTPHERYEYCKALFRSWLAYSLHNAFNANVIEVETHPDWIAIRDRISEECRK